MSVKSSEDGPKPGMNLTAGAGSGRRPLISPTALSTSSRRTFSTCSGSEGEVGHGHVVVGDYASGELVVRYYDNIIRGLAELCRPPAYVRYKTFFSGAYLYVVSAPDGPLHQEVHSGEKVRERVLERERHGKAPDAQCGEHGGDRHAQA